MGAAARWSVAVAASVAAFFVVAVPWAVISEGPDPWDVIGPVAGVVAAGVLAALGWWASQAGTAAGGTTRTVRQSVRARGDVRQTAGDQGAASTTGPRPARERIRQKARGGGDIDQVGGNRS